MLHIFRIEGKANLQNITTFAVPFVMRFFIFYRGGFCHCSANNKIKISKVKEKIMILKNKMKSQWSRGIVC